MISSLGFERWKEKGQNGSGEGRSWKGHHDAPHGFKGKRLCGTHVSQWWEKPEQIHQMRKFPFLFHLFFSYAEDWTQFLVLLSMYSTTEPHPQPPLLGIFEGMKTVTKSNLFIMNANLPAPAPESEPTLIQQLSRSQGIKYCGQSQAIHVVKAAKAGLVKQS